MQDQEVYQQLERLAVGFPWDEVAIWITREPQGIYKFTSYIQSNDRMGWQSVFGHGPGLTQCVDQALEQGKDRDPEKQRKAKIAELRLQIMKLEALTFDLAPYRAPNQLGFGVEREPERSSLRVVDITSSSMEVL